MALGEPDGIKSMSPRRSRGLAEEALMIYLDSAAVVKLVHAESES